MMLLRKDRNRRMQKPETLVKAIDRILSAPAESAAPDRLRGSSGRLARVRPGDAESTPVQRFSNGLVIGVTAAAALLIIGIGTWVMGGDDPPPPTGAAPTTDEQIDKLFAQSLPTVEPVSGPTVQGVLEIAVTYAREHPDDFEGVQERYEAAIDEFAETDPEMAQSAEDLFDQYISEYDDRAGQYFQELKRSADPHVRAGNFQKAYSILLQFAQKYPHSREHMGSYQNMIGDLFDRELRKQQKHFGTLMASGKYRRVRQDVAEIATSFGVSKDLTPELYARLQATYQLIEFEEGMHLEGEDILRNWNVLSRQELSDRLAKYQNDLVTFYPNEEMRALSVGNAYAEEFMEKLRWETFEGWEVFYPGTILINGQKEIEMNATEKTAGFIRRDPGKNFTITCEFLVEGGKFEWTPHVREDGKFWTIALGAPALDVREGVWNRMIFQVRDNKIIVKLNDNDPIALKAPKDMPATGPTGFFIRTGSTALVRNLEFHAK
jgi:hypothetical protein